jgi:ethanolamine utilization protein EutQ (cupin superfamily)
MPELISSYTRIPAAGSPPKIIEEAVGRLNTGEDRLSIALMTAPAGWAEPFQTPEFDEWTVVTEGGMDVESDGTTMTVTAGQTVLVRSGERVRYSTPNGAKYVAICLPAFHPDTVRRESE